MAKTKKTTDPIEADVVEQVEQEYAKSAKKNYRTGSIFWGLVFIFVGVLVLLDNLNIVNVHFGSLWQLWPVFIIGAGVSMLSLRGWLSSFISVILAVVFAGLAYFVAVDNPYYDVNFGVKAQTSSVSSVAPAGVTALELTLTTGAMDISLEKNDGSNTYAAMLSSNHMSIRQDKDTVTDGVQRVSLVTDSSRDWWIGHMNNSLTLSLTDKLPLNLVIDTGASSVSGDLSSVQLRSLTLKAGASSVNLKFGTMQPKQDVTVEAGASSVRLSVPNGAGVRIEADNGLSHTDFASVDKVSDGVYESAGFSSAEKQITIHAKLGVSSFELKRY